MGDFNLKDMPWQCHLNWVWRKFGWEAWWRYQYVGNSLEFSELHWKRYRPTHNEGEQ